MLNSKSRASVCDEEEATLDHGSGASSRKSFPSVLSTATGALDAEKRKRECESLAPVTDPVEMGPEKKKKKKTNSLLSSLLADMVGNDDA